MSKPIDAGAAALLEVIKDEARKWVTLAANVDLEAYRVGPQGNFPWYFQAGQDFNAITYDWISKAPTIHDGVVQQGELGNFATQYREIIKNIVYKLSKDEQAELDKYNNDNAAAASNLVNQWTKTYGRFSDEDLDGTTPIDLIFQTVTASWVSDPKTPVSISDLVNSSDLGSVLTNIPASGYPLLGAIGTYLGSAGLNARTMNKKVSANAELAAIFTAVTKLGEEPPKKKPLNQKVEADMHLSNKTFGLQFAISPTTNELKGTLEDDRREFSLSIDITHDSDKVAQVSVSGGTRFSIPILSLFAMKTGASASYFSSKIYKNSTKITLKVTFKGITTASVAPADYDANNRTGWLWKYPVQEAIKNIGKADPIGYSFITDATGSQLIADDQGWVSVVAFCQQPDFEITAQTDNYARIEKDFKTHNRVGLTFLGIPIGPGASSDTYNAEVTTDASSSTVTIKIPTPRTVEVSPAEQTAWILGVDTEAPFKKIATRAALNYVQNAASYARKPAFVEALFQQFSLKHEDQPTIHRKPAPVEVDDVEEKDE